MLKLNIKPTIPYNLNIKNPKEEMGGYVTTSVKIMHNRVLNIHLV